MHNQHKTPELAEQAGLTDAKRLLSGYPHISHAGTSEIRWSRPCDEWAYQYLWFAVPSAVRGLEMLTLHQRVNGSYLLHARIYGLPYEVEISDPQLGIPALQAAVLQARNRYQVELTRLDATVGLLSPQSMPALLPTGTQCSACGEPQFNTQHGPCCQNGHGGAAPK